MKYVVDLNGERHRGRGRRRIRDLRRSHGAGAASTELEGTPVRLVTIGSEVHRIVVRRGAIAGAYTLWVDGFRFDGEALDERTRAIRDITAASSKPTGPAPVIAPMPGLIVRVASPSAISAGGPGTRRHGGDEDGERAARLGRGSREGGPGRAGKAVEKGTMLVEVRWGRFAPRSLRD